MKKTAKYLLSVILICIMTSNSALTQVRIWATGSTEKVQRENRSRLPHDRIWDESANTAKIVGVKGEHVPFQIVITADQVNVFGVTIEKTSLKKGNDILSEENIHLYFEQIIKVYAPSGSHGEYGWWPDALVPLSQAFDIRSDNRGRPLELRNQPIWVDIFIPQDQEAGMYKGSLTVLSEDGELGNININLEVLDLSLPNERHFPALMRIGPNDVARAHELDRESPEFNALYHKYLEQALDSRIDPRYLLSYGLEGKVVDCSATQVSRSWFSLHGWSVLSLFTDGTLHRRTHWVKQR